MSAAAVALVVTALDAVADLDACSREEKIACARKILERTPASLPVEVAGWVRDSGKKLHAKLKTDSLGNNRRLAYVAAIACNGPPALPPQRDERTQTNEASSKAEADFLKQAVREMRDLEADTFRDEGRNRRAEALNAWMRDRGLPTPHWALGGFDSPEDHERAKRQPLRPMGAQPPALPVKRAHQPEETPTLSDAIELSRELERNHVANERYAEDDE